MDEILALQQQLAAAQQTNITHKLSDRNCVELVMKLQELNLIKLIFTRTGKEYLTHKQLKLEIQDEIQARGGRVNVINLPDALNVDLHHIESKLPEIIEEDDNLRLERGELLTDFYLVSLAEEINDSLTESENGIDDIGQIATRYSLPVSVVQETVEKYQNSVINAIFDVKTGILISSSSIARQHATVRGLLSGISVPTMLSSLSKISQISLPMLKEVTESMIKCRDLAGQLRGKGSQTLFIPRRFIEVGLEDVYECYSGNGFVNLNQLERAYIDDIDTFIQENLEESIKLDQCVVGPVLLESYRTIMSEAIDTKGWLSLPDALPPSFPFADYLNLANLVATKNNRNILQQTTSDVLSRRNATHLKPKRQRKKSTLSNKKSRKLHPGPELNRSNEDSLLDDLLDELLRGEDEYIEVDASTIGINNEELKGQVGNKTQNQVSDSNESLDFIFPLGEDCLVTMGLISMVKKFITSLATEYAKNRAKDFATNMDVSVTSITTTTTVIEEDNSVYAEQGKKVKTKRRRKADGKATTSEQLDQDEGKRSSISVEVPSVDELCDLAMADDLIAKAAKEDVLANSKLGDEVIENIIRRAYGENVLQTEYKNKTAEAIKELERNRVRTKLNSEKMISTGLAQIELLDKATGSLYTKKLVSSSQAWIREKTCADVMYQIALYVAQNTGVQYIAPTTVTEFASNKKKIEVLQTITEKLPPPLPSIMQRMISLLNRQDGTVSAFLKAYDENASVLDLPERHPLDQQQEETLAAEMKANMNLALNDTKKFTELHVLQMCAILVHAMNLNGIIVSIPIEATVQFCEAVEQNCQEAEVAGCLQSLRECSKGLEEDKNSEGFGKTGISEDFAEKLGNLRKYIR